MTHGRHNGRSRSMHPSRKCAPSNPSGGGSLRADQRQAKPLFAVVAAGILIPAATLLPAAVLISAAFLSPGTASGDDFETPQTRLRPIGSPSAVDTYRRAPTVQPASGAPDELAKEPSDWRPVERTGDPPAPAAVRQAVMMQAADAPFSMPPGDAAAGPATSLPVPLGSAPGAGPIAPPPQQTPPGPRPRQPAPQQNQPAPQQNQPPQQRPTTSLPNPPAFDPTHAPGTSLSPVPRSPGGAGGVTDDYAPLAQPRLDQGFATLGNCRNISGPSGYRADRMFTCGPPASYVTTIGATAPPPTYLPPPAQLGPPATLPPVVVAPEPFPAGPTVIPGNSGHRPLISFGQERYLVQIGQGIFGQPVAYVPGQTFRNALRYIAW